MLIPRELNNSFIVITSNKFGTLDKLDFSLVNKLDANIGYVAFLEPLIVIIPSSVFPPRIDILSITI